MNSLITATCTRGRDSMLANLGLERLCFFMRLSQIAADRRGAMMRGASERPMT
jgi:hypothetical protein